MFYNDLTYLEDINNSIKNIEFPKDTSILITGVSGLIGSFLVDALMTINEAREDNLKIYGLARNVDNLGSRFSKYMNSNNLEFIKGNIIEGIPNEIEFDYIINLASNADPKNYALYPVETILTNIRGTQNILEYCKKHNKCRALLTSTFEVYGEVENGLDIKEEDYGMIDQNVIRSGYPESKRVSELLVKSYVEEYKVDALIVRLSSIYGPTMKFDDSKAAAQFIRNALKRENIVLKSKGDQKRSYTYVSDCVQGILIALLHGTSGEVYNVSNPKSTISIAEFAKIVATESSTDVVFDSPNFIETKGFGKKMDSVLSSQKLMELGYSPLYNAEKGIHNSIKILKQKVK